MSEQTHIAWCDSTWNPWIGCTKVSPGCDHCYAETLMDTRYGRVKWGAGNPRSRTSAANWKLPARWNAQGLVCVDCGTPARAPDGDCACGQIGAIGKLRRRRVFCASLADWLDNEVPITWLVDLLNLIRCTPNLDWMLLTKRIGNWRPRLIKASYNTERGTDLWRWIIAWSCSEIAPPNVLLGITICNQGEADRDIPKLLQTPAAVRFISAEPLLGPLNLCLFLPAVTRGRGGPVRERGGLDWVIVGGESGSGSRPCHVDWIRSIVQQCRATGTACFVKQFGARPVRYTHADSPRKGLRFAYLSLRDRKGGNPAEWPADLRIRQFPEAA